MRNFGRLQSFTLIELLIVIAIIAILAALLFPALSKAKDVAVTNDCRTRQKQIHCLAVQWSADHDEFWLGPNNFNDLSVYNYNYYYWFSTEIMKYVNPKAAANYSVSQIPPTDNSYLLRCPGTSWVSKGMGFVGAGSFDNFDKYASSYGYGMPTWYMPNAYFSCRGNGPFYWPGKEPKRMGSLKKTIVYLAEVGWLGAFFGHDNSSNNQIRWNHGKKGNPPNWATGGASNFLFTDGHVESHNARRFPQWGLAGFDGIAPCRP